MKKFIQQKLLPKSIGAYLGGLAYINAKASGHKALQIFGTPRRGKIRPKDDAFLSSFTKTTLHWKDISIQAYARGNGSLRILFLHGWESNTARWRDVMNYTEKHLECTIYAIDAPAHGATSGTTFDSIQYANCIQVAYQYFKPTILIGHSIGAGSICYCMSELQNLPVEKIVLLGSPNGFEEILKTYTDIIGLNRKGKAALEQTINKRYKLKPTDYNVAKYAQAINCPTLILHDEDDEVTPVTNATLIANGMPNAKLVITKGYKHSLQHKVVYEKIIDFIKY